MAFLRNAWYVACWSDALTAGKLLSKTLLGEKVVLYRDSNGIPAALKDMCPHRFAPLSMGRLCGDAVECAYHGLRFDRSGKCTHNPHGDGKIPQAAFARSYGVCERHNIIWIWMGHGECNPSKIPNYSMLDSDSGFHLTKGDIVLDANYILENENLLDLSHVPVLHAGLLGSAEMTKTLPTVREEGGNLFVDRVMPNVTVPSVFDMLFRNDGRRVDAWQNMQWIPPSNFLLDTGVTTPGGTRDEGAWFYGIHLLTPETESSTHYHFASARPPSSSVNSQLDADIAASRLKAFAEQDKPMVEAQQQIIGERDVWAMKPVLLPTDAGAVRMRRLLEKSISAEQAEG